MKNQETNLTSSNTNTFHSHFIHIFNTLVSIEQELDTLRQLLNQQIAFNLKDLYVIVAGPSSAINYRHILNFVKKNNENDQKQNTLNESIQSLIKYYNGNTSLNLSFSQFSSIFLNRQNRLLMKMTLQRDSIGTLPNFILNFSRKILYKQIELHNQLLKFRYKWSTQSSNFIQLISNDEGNINEQKLIKYLCEQTNKPVQKVKVQLSIFQRYLKAFTKDNIQKSVIQTLLVNTNAQTVTQYLKKKSKKKNSQLLGFKSISMQKPKTHTDPFIRPQFHDCLTRPKIIDMFSYRQVKSIQKHLDRLNQTIPINKQQIDSKLKKFQSVIQKNCQKVLQAIKDVIWLEKQIQYARIELSLCPDFYPVLFYECFHKDKQNRVIPSAMEIYFKQFGIKIPINEIYLIFKRYAWHLEGKMDFNSFCAMFDVCQTAYSRVQKNRQIKSLADVDVETKKNFLILLATLIKNEKKIDSIKSKLQKVKDLNLRDVFACFDTDEDGYLSMTDFRVVWKKYYNLEIAKQMISLLWFRMGYNNQNQIIRYQQFIKQMLPKSNISSLADKKLRKIKSQDNIRFRNKQNSKKIK